MVSTTLNANNSPDDFASRIGRLIEARGDMVEALFDPACIPDLMTELTVSDEAHKQGVTVQVMQRPGGGVVRGIAASPIKALARGATVLNERRRSIAPLNRTQLDRLLPLLTREANEIVETGIKVIDVMCPIRAGGSVALAGENGAGTTVVMEEIVRRIGNRGHPVTLLVLFPPPSELWPPSLDANYSIANELKKEGYSEGHGRVGSDILRGRKEGSVDRRGIGELCACRHTHSSLAPDDPAQELPGRRRDDHEIAAAGQVSLLVRRRSSSREARAMR